jgi:outer membrane protein insertion porin family
MRNLFGTGRKLSFNWQREDRNSQELGFRYVEPWVFSAPVNLGGGFSQRQQDTSYVRRVLDLKAELMFSEELSASLLFGSENIIPSADSSAGRVFRSSTTTIGVEFQYDTRDDIYAATSGARYRTDYSFGNKRTSNIPAAFSEKVASRVTIQRFALDVDFYLTTFARQVLALGVHERELQSAQMEEGELFRLGGTRTLRGYRENQFIGSRVAWSNTEYRFLLARRSFFYGFLDTGYYLRTADEVRSIPKSDGFRYGYGIGVQLETALGNLGVSFALGQGDTFGTGKIHFGLINEF